MRLKKRLKNYKKKLTLRQMTRLKRSKKKNSLTFKAKKNCLFKNQKI